MANVTFNLPSKERTIWELEPGKRCEIGVGVVRDAGTEGRFEARVVITAEDQLLISVEDADGSCRGFLDIDWVDLLVDSGPVIEALERENEQLRDRVHELERSAGLRS